MSDLTEASFNPAMATLAYLGWLDVRGAATDEPASKAEIGVRC